MSERDGRLPAATAAVVGQTNPSVQERIIPEKVAAKLKEINPDAMRPLRPLLERKRQQGGGHASG
jgi:hypothetical protein